MSPRGTTLLICAALACAEPAFAAGAGSAPGTDFERFAAGYLESYFRTHPVRATKLGIHAHDDRLPDLSRGAIKRRVKQLREELARLEALDRDALGFHERADHRILDHAIRAELLELEEVRGWQRNPMFYNRLMADAAASLVDRQFAPLDRRVLDLVARLDGYDAMIRAARKNLRDVPATWTELAVRNTRGHIRFLSEDLPAALRAQGYETLPPATRARWTLARRGALDRLQSFVAWLEEDLAPRSNGDFRLGRDLFERKLLYEEHVALSVEELVAINERAIRTYADWVAREATRLDPARSPAEVMQSVTEQHPEPDELIPTARRYVEQAQRFVIERGLLSLPTDELPIIRPTPEYARSSFASMSTPGPFETRATESYYNITNVDPGWTDEQQDQHLTYFNHAGLLGISIHEAMPGHFVQLLYQRELPTDVRKVFAPSSLVEGWAHYAEQMMLDEGLGDGDPAIRLGQLRRALQRHARWYAGIALHTGDTTVEAAARRFAEIAHFATFPALRETLRGTYDPTYLYYALGRMQILELREDYRRHVESRGEPFSLKTFHDRFLRLGLPVSLAREVLLADDR